MTRLWRCEMAQLHSALAQVMRKASIFDLNEAWSQGFPDLTPEELRRYGFFAENAGLLTEECAPYTARTKGRSCSDFSHCKPHAKVAKSYYVNGYNFPPTEM